MAFDREKTLQAAQKYVEKRKYDRAIQEYQKVVQQEPNDARTLLRIGDLQSRMGAHPDAIATYDRVALYYAGKGHSLKAVAVLKQIGELIERHAPQLADQYGHVLPKLAQIYGELGLINDALATYDAVARRLQDRNRDRDAVEIIRRMVALDRANPLPYLRLAEALCRVSRVEEAIEHFWSAAQLLTQQGRPEDSLKVLERILHFRQDPRVARVAAQLYLTRKTREAGMQALARLQLCFEADPKDLETLTLLAQAFDVIGQSSKGVEVYKEMVRIAFETGQKELHERYLLHLQRVAPDDPQVRALAAMNRRAPSERPQARHSSSPPELGDDDIEFLDDEAEAELEVVESEPPARARGKYEVSNVAGPPIAERANRSGSLAAVAPVTEGTLRPAAQGTGASEFLRKALVDAESFRGLKLYSKASLCLRQALANAPDSLELRAALQQVLLEAGELPAAIEQMLAVARMYIERGSLAAAEAELHQVIELAPRQPGALALLAQIEAARKRTPPRPPRAKPSEPAELIPEEPLLPPSQSEQPFELRTRVSSPALHAAEPEPKAPPAPPVGAPDAPLPAYDLEDEQTGRAHVPAARAEAPLPQFSLDSGLHNPPSLKPEPVSARPPQGRRESIRAALDEAEFFSARGLYQDASMILRDRLEQYPGDAELIRAIAELEPKLNTESGTRDVGRLSEEASPNAPAAPQPPRPAERKLAVAAAPPSSALGKELRVQFSTDGKLEHGAVIDADADLDLVNALEMAPDDQQQIDVDEVFAKFKQGVKAQVSDNDSATHYDLGVAYKEMGLLTDAAREFEIASRDPKRECTCLAMMGMMYRERGELDRAAEAYVRGLNAKHKTVAQEMSLYYDLGTVYETKGDADEAIYYYQRIARRDPTYRDVPQRLQALLPHSRRFSQPARAINDEQDFERSFDDLYNRE
ncbi:MAG TPA: tetratricopeptide repeat protein [Polyangiaceae bacterium]|nr:tetratricopeptide repeat protein [Polyangiaceae bacterium]